MKSQILNLLLSILVAGLCCSVSAQKPSSSTARSQPTDAAASGNTSSPSLTVTVSAEAWTGDFVTYKSGENFVVIVPQAKTSAIRWNLQGQGLGGIQVEQRGEDVVVLLRVNSVEKPAVRQRGNQLEIVFPVKPAATAPNISMSNDSADTSRTVSTANNAVPSASIATPSSSGAPAPNLAQPANAAAVQGAKDFIKAFVQRNTTADALNLDLLVPESPAFTVLGLTPQTVVRPATPQEFATSLINGLDQNGHFQNGLAIDTAPYMLFNGENVTIRDYMDQYLTRLLSRTQFSLAVTKGSSNDDLSTRLAAGLNFTLWDRGDPRVYRPGEEGDVLDCFVRNLRTDIIIPPSVDPNKPEEVRNFVGPELDRLKGVADQCRADGQKARWNRSAWTLAYAPSWISKTGQNSDFKWNGGAFWTSLAYGFEEVPSLKKIGQLIFHARYRSREEIPDEAQPGQFLTQNTFFVGARFRAGSPKFALNFEDGFLRTKRNSGRIDSSNRFTIGSELRLSDNLYFVISAGGNTSREDGKNKGFVMTSFKYGFNKKPQLTPQPQ